MDTATLAFPVLALVLLAVLVALPGDRTPQPRTPQPRPPRPRSDAADPLEPLPPDQRAHLSWLADHTGDDGARARALELLAVDDRRRGLDQLRRPRARA